MTADSTTSINPRDHTLLIVDDEVDLRELLAFSFQKVGFKVLEAGNGREAFEIVKAGGVDLIISDIRMPGGGGIELLDNVRSKHNEVPVVLFLTGFNDISVEDAYNKGAEAVFAKPFDFKVVLKTVFLALEAKSERWQRKHCRAETSVPIEFRCEGLAEARAGQLMNVGRGGIFMTMRDPLPVGATVHFKIQFTGGPILLIEGSGVVRWARPPQPNGLPAGCGVEFLELTDQVKNKVIALINFLMTKQYIPKI